VHIPDQVAPNVEGNPEVKDNLNFEGHGHHLEEELVHVEVEEHHHDEVNRIFGHSKDVGDSYKGGERQNGRDIEVDGDVAVLDKAE
jgi:hypothetical protein